MTEKEKALELIGKYQKHAMLKVAVGVTCKATLTLPRQHQGIHNKHLSNFLQT